jgi:MFS family permease
MRAMQLPHGTGSGIMRFHLGAAARPGLERFVMKGATSSASGRPELFYSSAGHMLMHLMTAFYATIVLALEKEWNLPFAQLITLWSLGAIMIGAAAMPAGWLADKWSSPGMIVVMFFGMGLSAIFCAFAPTGDLVWLSVGLAGIGLFAAIYHPVGIPWVMRTAGRQGASLGINGIFGSAGNAAAGIAVGLLISALNWRAAFIVPGAVCLLLGVSMFVHWRAGRIGDRPMPAVNGKPPSKGDMIKVFFILMVTMFFSGIIYQFMQNASPKLFEGRLSDLVGDVQAFFANTFNIGGDRIFWVGAAVSSVYIVSGVMQYHAGKLADRFPLKVIYLACFALQAAVMAAMAVLVNLPLLAAAMFSALLSVGALPAESILIGRYTPTKYHGLAFGSKYILAFGAGPVALWMIGLVQGRTGEFTLAFYILAGLVAIAALAALLLPREEAAGPQDAAVEAATRAGVTTPADEAEIIPAPAE